MCGCERDGGKDYFHYPALCSLQSELCWQATRPQETKKDTFPLAPHLGVLSALVSLTGKPEFAPSCHVAASPPVFLPSRSEEHFYWLTKPPQSGLFLELIPFRLLHLTSETNITFNLSAWGQLLSGTRGATPGHWKRRSFICLRCHVTAQRRRLWTKVVLAISSIPFTSLFQAMPDLLTMMSLLPEITAGGAATAWLSLCNSWAGFNNSVAITDNMLKYYNGPITI